MQKIGYDNAAAVAKKAHKEGTTLKVILHFLFLFALALLCSINILSLNFM
jgi:fumarate hydratase class II